MKIRTEREEIKGVVEYNRPYPGMENKPWKDGKTRGEMLEELKALDLDTATIEDVEAITGHKNCMGFYCVECRKRSEIVIEIPTGLGDDTITLCRKCTEKAILLFNQHDKGDQSSVMKTVTDEMLVKEILERFKKESTGRNNDVWKKHQEDLKKQP